MLFWALMASGQITMRRVEPAKSASVRRSPSVPQTRPVQCDYQPHDEEAYERSLRPASSSLEPIENFAGRHSDLRRLWAVQVVTESMMERQHLQRATAERTQRRGRARARG